MDNGKQDWRSQFFGRKPELEWLQEAWEQVVDPDSPSPQMRVLYANSGFGKTKVAQRFYTWLSEARDPEHYWPDTLLHEGQNLRVMPRFEEARPGVSVPWFWFGLRWPDRDDRNQTLDHSPFTDVYTNPVFTVHGEAVARELEKRRLAGRITYLLGKTGLNVFSAGVASGLADMAKDLVEVGEILKESLEIRSDHQLSSDNERAQAQSERLVHEMRKQREQVLATFFALLDKGKGQKGQSLPVILLLDDAHWIQPLGLQILDDLWRAAQKHRWPLLVLATCWEREWHEGHASAATPDTFAAWCARRETSASSCRIQARQLGPLGENAEILKKALPGLSPENAAYCLERAHGNPRHLAEIIFKLARQPTWFIDRDSSLDLTPVGRKQLSRHSLEVDLLERERFDAIDEALKELLGLGAQQGLTFLREFTLKVAGRIDGFCGNQASLELLDQAHIPHGLAERLGEAALEFRSPNLQRAAAQYFEDTREDFAPIREAILDEGRAALVDSPGGWAAVPEEARLPLLEFLYQQAQEDAPLRLHTTLQAIGTLGEQGNFIDIQRWLLRWEDLPTVSDADLHQLPWWTVCKVQRAFYAINELTFRDRLLDLLDGHPEAKGDGLENQRLRAIVQAEKGDRANARDDPDSALVFYERSLELREQILRDFGSTAERLRDLSVSLSKVGDVRWEAKDNPDGALTLYERSLELFEQIMRDFGPTAERLRDLSLSLDRVGYVRLQAKDDPDAALTLYERSLEISEQLLRDFGPTAERLRDLSVSLERVGDVRRKAKDDPDGALSVYERSQAIREQILRDFGATAERLGDLSISLDRVGGVRLQAKDDPDGALSLYERSLAIREQILRDYGPTAGRLRDLATTLYRIGYIEEKRGHKKAALIKLEQIFALYEQIAERIGLNAQLQSEKSIIEEQLARLRQEVS